MTKTVVVELVAHMRVDEGRSGSLRDDIDLLNDMLIDISQKLDMDIISISHSHDYSPGHVAYYSTCIYMRNGQSLKNIEKCVGRSDSTRAYAEGDNKVRIHTHLPHYRVV